MNRTGRLQLIRELLEAAPAPSQDALVESLAARGVQITQATLSRDLRELGVVKTPEGYVLAAALASPLPAAVASVAAVRGLRATGSLERALRSHLTGVRCGVGIVVCTTAPGHAQVIALELDRTPPQGVIGTVAGDDTVFIAVDSAERVATLAGELMEMGGLSSVDLPGDQGTEDRGDTADEEAA